MVRLLLESLGEDRWWTLSVLPVVPNLVPVRSNLVPVRLALPPYSLPVLRQGWSPLNLPTWTPTVETRLLLTPKNFRGRSKLQIGGIKQARRPPFVRPLEKVVRQLTLFLLLPLASLFALPLSFPSASPFALRITNILNTPLSANLLRYLPWSETHLPILLVVNMYNGRGAQRKGQANPLGSVTREMSPPKKRTTGPHTNATTGVKAKQTCEPRLTPASEPKRNKTNARTKRTRQKKK